MDKVKILIVEDSFTQAMQLQNILEENGYDAVIAANGREALGAIGRTKPSVVISDIVMPEMDGYELCRRIKADEKYRDIGVILLTSLSQPQAVIWALQCGADKFITKPYDEKYLLATLENLRLNDPLMAEEGDRKAIPLSYRGETYFIVSNRSQILNLLLSTYETAMVKNFDLIKAQDELTRLNRDLEERINKRTEALRGEVAERQAAEAALQAKNEELNTVMQQLWQAAKLATMGELASSIAHELNNPLATVSLRIESLLGKTAGDDPRRRELGIVGQEVERMGKLVTNLLQFSRRSPPQISTVDVCEEIEKSLELIDYHFRKGNIRVVREFAPAVPGILADRQQLRQLFLNLFTNAADAMPGGGTLLIRVAERAEEKNVCIEIADTGNGIPAEILPKVMEPFYTTKPEGKGTGLGLAICRRIVQEHRGTFQIRSEGIPGRGTKVRMTLSMVNQGNATCLKDQ